MKRVYLLMVIVTALIISACAEESTYKVEEIGGVPRITFDGKPQRARMLYVSPTYFTPVSEPVKPLSEKWRTYSFDISKLSSNINNGVCHIKASLGKCVYHISKFEIKEKDTGNIVYNIDFSQPTLDPKITFWCKAKNSPHLPLIMENYSSDDAPKGAMKVEIKKDSPLMAGFHVYFKDIKLSKDKKYKAKLRIKTDAEFAPLNFGYSLYEKKDGAYKKIAPQGKSNVEPQVRMARDAGVDIVTFPVQAEDYYIKDGEQPNYSYLESALSSIVKNNENAKILVRIRFYPSAKWLKENPDSTLTYFDGKKSVSFPSISSLKFREQSQNALRMIIDYAEKHYGKNVIGYHPGGGNSCEWFYGDSWSRRWSGYDKSTEIAWKKWLEKKYKDDATLQKAWKNPNAKIAEEKVPTKAEREAPTWLIDPQKYQRIIDFNEFWNDEMVDMIDCLATVIREKVPNKLCVFFYGYAGEFSGMYNGLSYSGHLKLDKLLKSGKIDALCGPISYSDRKFGDGKSTMGATETITRAGTLWIDEDDTSTYLAPKVGLYPGIERDLDTREKTLDVLKRNMAHEAVRNIGSWWMDLSGGGFFKDAKLWELKPAFDASEKDIIENSIKFEPEVALILDETSAYYCAANGSSAWIVSRSFGRTRAVLNRSSISFGHYLLDDVLFGKPLNSKLDIYAVTYALDKKKRDAIKERAKKNTSIFIWASGYIDLDKNKFSQAALEDLTGFKFKNIQDGTANHIFVATDEGKKIGLPEKMGYGSEYKYNGKDKIPYMFSPITKAGDVVYATYENGAPAIVRRGKTLYCGLPSPSPAIYREMARVARAHLYTNLPAAVYSNGKYISITPTDIEKDKTPDLVVTVPDNKEIFDAITGEKLGQGTFQCKTRKGDTLFLKIQ